MSPVRAKFSTCFCPKFLSTRCVQISFRYITWKNIKVIQCCVQETDSDRYPWYHACIPFIFGSSGVSFPFTTSLVFHVNSPSIFVSNTIWRPISLCPGNFVRFLCVSSGVIFSPFSKLFNPWIFFISLFIVLIQYRVPFLVSIAYASSTVWGNSMPNLCLVFQYLLLIFEIILSFFFKTKGTHHLKLGSLSICWLSYILQHQSV